MTAIACLRILFTDGESRPGEVPKHKAQGVADAFLKARWRKPRKCGAVAPLAFVIADTRVDQLDPTELQALAAELEKVLFPGRPIGTIALMSFEGDEQAVLQPLAPRPYQSLVLPAPRPSDPTGLPPSRIPELVVEQRGLRAYADYAEAV